MKEGTVPGKEWFIDVDWEKTKLEREIAEHNAKLEDIAKQKAATEANLAKMKY